MPRLIVLGNCVAERLTLLLEGLLSERKAYCPGISENWEVLHRKPVHNMLKEELEPLAAEALRCECVFSQPLFSFGPCNTAVLREKLGDRLHTFSAPNFEAYFPDVMDIRPYGEVVKFDPPMEWHSKIIVMCKAAGIKPEDVGRLYPNHSLFKAGPVGKAIEHSLEIYEKRDTGVEIGSLEFVKNNYAREPLFYTWNHPGDALLKHLLGGMLGVLGLSRSQSEEAMTHLPWAGDSEHGWAEWGFGYNEWPIITRWHDHFQFPGREWFRIGGEKLPISLAALGWYNFYDFHPQIFQKALAACAMR